MTHSCAFIHVRPFLGTNASHPISIEALQEIMQKRREHNEKFAIVTFGSLDPRDSTFSNPVQNTSCF
jgi:serine phosphatase RsbU (regulator of sigma subunit)